MDLSLKNSRIKVTMGDHCSVGFVARIIERRNVHYTKVAGLRSIVPKRQRQLGKLFRAFESL